MGILHDTDSKNVDASGVPRVIEGKHVERLTDEQWDAIMARSGGIVFARTTPQHKLDIVRRCRALGAVVAVTGDGVNDAPAMRAAQCGVFRRGLEKEVGN